MRPAVIIVDMLQGNYRKEKTGDKEEEKIIGPVREFLKVCRGKDIPVIFACDSFLKEDFIFKGRMKPHALRGTKDTLPLEELEPQEGDVILEKRRFSAFFKTDLDQTLRTWDIDTVLIGGVNTHFCVLATAFDAVCHDFYTIILEDLSAAYDINIHKSFMDAYRYSAIYPLFRVMLSKEFLELYDKKDIA
ncbi:MAG TPA: isochorismatase family cysteine hydrolase [Syntrophorhabdaceae bacterium]|nr:isochorismatase family cysteine hydrolase [Syntrophorhabdaceae bacterium]HOL06229.1 isochorismatase family cysteine hydrolase [Syntrophorhabdaceae bacterium]HON84612.1 isochorismatase family cysteine hydrolase [Syntrophorhabdaceae bacterium]HOT41115.1 isochorismatase family cysteine hydrolase [Syntrophorhabdaceae bacterium]HPC66182.1 isochorismatase family cysteine hydrolase [Syntrophorhabdaceae bacterium]